MTQSIWLSSSSQYGQTSILLRIYHIFISQQITKNAKNMEAIKIPSKWDISQTLNKNIPDNVIFYDARNKFLYKADSSSNIQTPHCCASILIPKLALGAYTTPLYKRGGVTISGSQMGGIKTCFKQIYGQLFFLGGGCGPSYSIECCEKDCFRPKLGRRRFQVDQIRNPVNRWATVFQKLSSVDCRTARVDRRSNRGKPVDRMGEPVDPNATEVLLLENSRPDWATGRPGGRKVDRLAYPVDRTSFAATVKIPGRNRSIDSVKQSTGQSLESCWKSNFRTREFQLRKVFDGPWWYKRMSLAAGNYTEHRALAREIHYHF